MRGGGKQKRIMKEADRIVSLKEDIDMLSWDRVLEIGKRLAAPLSDDERKQISDELIGIAQSNIGLSFRLGITTLPSQGSVMASGMEVIAGGLAETALVADGKRELPMDDSEDFEPEEPLVLDGASCESDVLPASQEHSSPESVSFASEVPPAPEDTTCESDMQPVFDDASLESEQETAACSIEADETGDVSLRETPPRLSVRIEPTPRRMRFVTKSSAHKSRSASTAAVTKSHVATFRHLYESRDGSLAVFEDKDGHLVAVDSSKLA